MPKKSQINEYSDCVQREKVSIWVALTLWDESHPLTILPNVMLSKICEKSNHMHDKDRTS